MLPRGVPCADDCAEATADCCCDCCCDCWGCCMSAAAGMTGACMVLAGTGPVPNNFSSCAVSGVVGLRGVVMADSPRRAGAAIRAALRMWNSRRCVENTGMGVTGTETSVAIRRTIRCCA
jgi:hypothetical protein